MELFVGMILGMIVLLVVDAFRQPRDHERALTLSLLAQDLAARSIVETPHATFYAMREDVIAALKAHPVRVTRNGAALSRAATAALVRLGIRDDADTRKAS